MYSSHDNLGEEQTPLAVSAMGAGKGALEWGIAHLHPRLMYRLLFTSGLQSAPGQSQDTVIQEVAPGITLNIGKRWVIDYTPTMRFYSAKGFQDTVDHNVVASGSAEYRDWRFTVSQVYANTSEPLVETAAQTHQEIYSTTVGAGYHINSQWSLELGLQQNLRFVGQGNEQFAGLYTDSFSWSSMDWLNYQVVPNIGLAVGAGGGYDEVKVGPNMTFEQLQGRITWVVVKKLLFAVTGGVEDRQFLDSNVPDALNPIFTLSAQYRLFTHTTLTLAGSRTVGASLYAGLLNETTSLTAGLNQRLLGRFSLDLTGGSYFSTYSAITQGRPVQRNDQNTFFNARLSTPFAKRGVLAVFFQQNDNSSGSSLYQYSTSQAGLEIGYRY